MSQRPRNRRPIGRDAETLLEPGGWNGMRLAWRLLRDPRVAPRLKVVVPLLSLLYLLWPLDVVPDIFLGLGQLDDLGAIGIAVYVLTQIVPRLAPPAVVAEHLAAMGLTVEPTLRRTRDAVIEADYRVEE